MSKDKVLILNPPRDVSQEVKYDPKQRLRPPLDLAYLQAIIKKMTPSVFVDAAAQNFTVAQTLDLICNLNPKVIVLTSTPLDRWECPYLSIDSVFEIINKTLEKTRILCGAHGTITPEWVFKHCKPDYVVRGEPEMIVKKLVQAILSGRSVRDINGISYMDPQTKRVTHHSDALPLANLDDLPFPAYEDLDLKFYHYTSSDIPTPFTTVLASRGCPFRCTYCFKKMMPLPYRVRKPEKIVEELKILEKKFGVKGVFFQDLEFTISKIMVEETCRLISKNKLKIRWGCNARATDFSEKLMVLMKRAGCVRINIGFESGSQTILDNVEKLTTVEDNLNAVKIARKLGINIGTYGLINAPGENLQTLQETAKVLVKNRLEQDLWWNVPVPYFGTKLFAQLGKHLNDWPSLSKYTGKIKTRFSPSLAKIILNFYIIRERFGGTFYLERKFWTIVIDRILRLFKK
jgi:radical SAM superfamily enzyme YgiQ (UPF0313 family)